MVDIAMPDPTSELALLRAALAAAEARATAVEAELSTTKMVLAQHRAVVSTSEAVIAALKLEIALLKREQYGRSAERTARLIDQMELQLEELETAATEDAIQADHAMTKTTKVAGFDRRHPVKKPFPAHPLRERVVVEAPSACTCCGSAKIVKMGEVEEDQKSVRGTDFPTTHRDAGGGAPAVEGDPDRQSTWGREKFTCRD